MKTDDMCSRWQILLTNSRINLMILKQRLKMSILRLKRGASPFSDIGNVYFTSIQEGAGRNFCWTRSFCPSEAMDMLLAYDHHYPYWPRSRFGCLLFAEPTWFKLQFEFDCDCDGNCNRGFDCNPKCGGICRDELDMGWTRLLHIHTVSV